MLVPQARVSAIETGGVESTDVATPREHITALGGRLEIVADFGDRRLTPGRPSLGVVESQVEVVPPDAVSSGSWKRSSLTGQESAGGAAAGVTSTGVDATMAG